MGKLISICQSCTRARATLTFEFSTGHTIEICSRCDLMGEMETD